jgi:hypothetical protein
MGSGWYEVYILLVSNLSLRRKRFWPWREEVRVNYPTRRKDARVNYPTRWKDARVNYPTRQKDARVNYPTRWKDARVNYPTRCLRWWWSRKSMILASSIQIRSELWPVEDTTTRGIMKILLIILLWWEVSPRGSTARKKFHTSFLHTNWKWTMTAWN